MSLYTHLRHETDRGTLTGRLTEVANAAIDIVALSTSIHFAPGESVLKVDQPVIASDGTWNELPLRFTRTALRQQAERFGIPLRYVDLLADEQPDLLSHNFNQRSTHKNDLTLYRLLKMDGYWQVRAVLSNSFQAIDNLDMLTACVRGAARANIDLGDCHLEADWTDDRFRMRIAVPQIEIHAADLLGDYRSPFGRGLAGQFDWSTHNTQFQRELRERGVQVGDAIWAGLEASNSETGGGAASLGPRAMVLACLNGLTRKVDLVRSVHLGGRLEPGPVQWSMETRRHAVELIESKMADAVSKFCSEDYLNELANEMRQAKGVPVVNVVKAMEVAKARLAFSDDEVEAALNAFTASGDTSVFGIGQAFTAVAQTVTDGDRQTEIEQAFWDIVAKPHLYSGAGV